MWNQRISIYDSIKKSTRLFYLLQTKNIKLILITSHLEMKGAKNRLEKATSDATIWAMRMREK